MRWLAALLFLAACGGSPKPAPATDPPDCDAFAELTLAAEMDFQAIRGHAVEGTGLPGVVYGSTVAVPGGGCLIVPDAPAYVRCDLATSFDDAVRDVGACVDPAWTAEQQPRSVTWTGDGKAVMVARDHDADEAPRVRLYVNLTP